MIAFIIGVTVGIIYYYRRQKSIDKKLDEANSTQLLPNKKVFVESLHPDQPVGFGYKNLWFAVQHADKYEIAELLDLKILGNSNWKDGLGYAYDYRIFITPEVDGWRFIVGHGLLNKIEGYGTDADLCDKLSLKFKEAQFFTSHRVTEYHVWCKSLNGKLQRYYSYLGEQGENLRIEGAPSEIEKNINLVNTKSTEALEEDYFDRNDLVFPDEQFVMDVAGSWSIDPTKLENYKNVHSEFGLVCE
jgi:hypothetical protein